MLSSSRYASVDFADIITESNENKLAPCLKNKIKHDLLISEWSQEISNLDENNLRKPL